MTPGLFITGTDTGVGKTMLAATLLAMARSHGIDAIPMKPVQTGCARRDGRLLAPDLEFCLQAAGLTADPAEAHHLCPYRYEPACSPHLAARLAGDTISLATIATSFQALSRRHAAIIVEGAGGLMVPLTAGDTTMRELARQLGLPVVIAARTGLGTLNHSLLTVAALRAAALPIAAIVLIQTTDAPADTISADNQETLARLTGLPVLGPLPYLPGLTDNPGRLQSAPATLTTALHPLLRYLTLPNA